MFKITTIGTQPGLPGFKGSKMNNRGGARKGAGRKKKENKLIPVSATVPPEVFEQLKMFENRSEFIKQAIMEKLGYELINGVKE